MDHIVASPTSGEFKGLRLKASIAQARQSSVLENRTFFRSKTLKVPVDSFELVVTAAGGQVARRADANCYTISEGKEGPKVCFYCRQARVTTASGNSPPVLIDFLLRQSFKWDLIKHAILTQHFEPEKFAHD
jgi:hypothetical protein